MRLNDYILNEGINDKGILKAIFMAGTPGAGKSYVRAKLGGGVEPRVVNTDTWTEFFHLQKGQWDFYKEDIKRISHGQLSGYINSMLPLWIDGTSSKIHTTVGRKGLLKSFGYQCGMIWVNTSLDTAIARAEQREKEMGRHVDNDFIVKTWEKINAAKPKYKAEFKWFMEVNNDDGELTDKALSEFHKKTNSFFMSPLQSRWGPSYLEELKENGGKYLSDTDEISLDSIKQKAKGWYSY